MYSECCNHSFLFHSWKSSATAVRGLGIFCGGLFPHAACGWVVGYSLSKSMLSGRLLGVVQLLDALL